jgi:hypothetical protein
MALHVTAGGRFGVPGCRSRTWRYGIGCSGDGGSRESRNPIRRPPADLSSKPSGLGPASCGKAGFAAVGPGAVPGWHGPEDPFLAETPAAKVPRTSRRRLKLPKDPEAWAFAKAPERAPRPAGPVTPAQGRRASVAGKLEARKPAATFRTGGTSPRTDRAAPAGPRTPGKRSAVPGGRIPLSPRSGRSPIAAARWTASRRFRVTGEPRAFDLSRQVKNGTILFFLVYN